MTTPRVVSVNVGAVRAVEWQGEVVTTGIWKSPVTGRVALRGVNLAGDDQADRTVHGGIDKTVYAYAREDYAWWRANARFDTPDGLFGENLTTEGVDLADALVGERWRVGTMVLEVTQPRLPCFKLGIRMRDPHFLRPFLASGRLGAYFRSIAEGDVGADDAVEVVDRPDHGVTLATMARALHDPDARALLRSVPRLPAFWTKVAAER